MTNDDEGFEIAGRGHCETLEFKKTFAEDAKTVLWQLYRPEPFEGGAWPAGSGTFRVHRYGQTYEVYTVIK